MFLKTCVRLLRALLFVEICLVCGQEGSLLHPQCIKAFAPAPEHSLPWVRSNLLYQDPIVKRLIHQIKQKPSTDILDICLKGISFPYSSDMKIILIPIPASPDRMKHYGFNQAYQLASAVARYYRNYTVCDILEHTKISTQKQALLKIRTERLKNKYNTFSLSEEHYGKIRNKDIIIIDDVSTTGATLIEARRVLKNAGPTSIRAWTLSH